MWLGTPDWWLSPPPKLIMPANDVGRCCSVLKLCVCALAWLPADFSLMFCVASELWIAEQREAERQTLRDKRREDTWCDRKNLHYTTTMCHKIEFWIHMLVCSFRRHAGTEVNVRLFHTSAVSSQLDTITLSQQVQDN